MIRAYGTQAHDLLGKAQTIADLGEDFGATLTAVEVDWLIDHEYAQTAEDVLWRRTKLGLRLGAAQVDALEDHMTRRAARSVSAAAE
jgi:glycerol-3-phosphate dehydrogenase